jgi:hypothetical protein
MVRRGKNIVKAAFWMFGGSPNGRLDSASLVRVEGEPFAPYEISRVDRK